MMGISWMELMVIAVVALIVFGPKDLPDVLRTLARGLRAVRRTARDFQIQIDQFMRDSEIDTLRQDVEEAIRGKDSAPRHASPRPTAKTGSGPPPPPEPGPVPAPPRTSAPTEVAPTETDP